MLDADGSADPTEIPAFVGALTGGANFAKGSRFVRGGGSHDITLLRRWGNKGLSRMVNALFGTRYTDLCYGYNAFWRRCLPSMNIDCPGFEIETLINIRIARAGMTVVEVPSFERRRIHGRSNLRPLRDGLRVLRTILRERFGSPDVPLAPGAQPSVGVSDVLSLSRVASVASADESGMWVGGDAVPIEPDQR
jgi:hypothetical protein